jgi:hypothetical protein
MTLRVKGMREIGVGLNEERLRWRKRRIKDVDLTQQRMSTYQELRIQMLINQNLSTIKNHKSFSSLSYYSVLDRLVRA